METTMTDMSTIELLNAAVLALTRADAERLEQLRQAAEAAGQFRTVEEQRTAQQGLRTLGALIAHTRRNLRLLRGASGYPVLPD